MQSRKLDRPAKRAINKRAHDLATALYRPAFEDFQKRMTEDPRVLEGLISPEDWLPPVEPGTQP